jgi:hypothetical protein
MDCGPLESRLDRPEIGNPNGFERVLWVAGLERRGSMSERI